MRTPTERAAEAERLGPLEPPSEPTIADVGIGWFVSERQDEAADFWPRSGVCYEVTRFPDEETGELITTYRVVGQGDASNNVGRLRLHRLSRESIGSFHPPRSDTTHAALDVLLHEMLRKGDDKRELSEIFCRLRKAL